MKLRSRDTQEAIAQAEAVLRVDNSDRVAEAIAMVVPDAPPEYPHFALDAHVAADADIVDWVDERTTTKVGRALLHHMMRHPCTDAGVLRARAASKSADTEAGSADAAGEAEALWALTLPPLAKTWPLPFLFPTWPVLRLLNRAPLFLELLHAYRLWISPAIQIAYPIMIVLGPWLFLRLKLKWTLSLAAYIKLALRLIHSSAQMSTSTWFTVLVYGALYLYSTAQTVDVARVVYKWRKALKRKLGNITAFYEKTRAASHTPAGRSVAAAFAGLTSLAPLPPLGVSGGIRGAYELWTSERVKERIADALRWNGALDVIRVKEWVLGAGGAGSVVHWRHATPRLWSMVHPALAGAATPNPLCLRRNLVLTGPNAAGKTTYMRATLANALLAQTLGVVCAARAELAPFHGIATFMRVSDATGRASLFEAEVQRCLAMWSACAGATPHRPFLMLLDEPMHATPPTEGAAAAMAFLRMVAAVPGVRVMVTTHYYEVTDLAALAPETFANVSMEARVAAQTSAGPAAIAFPYRLRAGPSFQCIALELMRERDFPDAFIQDAIKMRNKICAARVHEPLLGDPPMGNPRRRRDRRSVSHVAAAEQSRGARV